MGPATESTASSADMTTALAGESDEPIFTCFPQLPIELRLMIIKYASNVPRVVPVQVIGAISWYQSGFLADGVEKFYTVPVPAVLQVNQEFRQEALKSYKLTSNGPPDIDISHLSHHARYGDLLSDGDSGHFSIYNEKLLQPVYHNSDADVVYLNDDALGFLRFRNYGRPDSAPRSAVEIHTQELLDKITTVATSERFAFWRVEAGNRVPRGSDGRHQILAAFAALETFIYLDAVPPWNALPSWRDLEVMDCKDLVSTSEPAEVVEMLKSDYLFEWQANQFFGEVDRERMEIMKAQKICAGGDGPSVILMTWKLENVAEEE